jgi:hypothetical protein
VQLPETNCARARESVSAQLDNELPDSEFDRLEAHLLVCPECSAWAEQVRGIAERLRATSLEQLRERVVLPGRGRSWRVSSAVAVASAAAIVATMFFAPGQQGSPSRQGVPPVSGFVGAVGPRVDVSRVVMLADGQYHPPIVAQIGFRHV